MNANEKLTAGAALALVLAAGAGFGIARLTAPTPQVEAAAEQSAAPSDSVAMTAEAIKTSQISVAPAASGELDSPAGLAIIWICGVGGFATGREEMALAAI